MGTSRSSDSAAPFPIKPHAQPAARRPHLQAAEDLRARTRLCTAAGGTPVGAAASRTLGGAPRSLGGAGLGQPPAFRAWSPRSFVRTPEAKGYCVRAIAARESCPGADTRPRRSLVESGVRRSIRGKGKAGEWWWRIEGLRFGVQGSVRAFAGSPTFLPGWQRLP